MYDLCMFFDWQSEELSTKLQESDLKFSQVSVVHRGELADREEHISRLKSDIRVLEERLHHSQSQVHEKKTIYLISIITL